jgi:hypothetical protein
LPTGTIEAPEARFGPAAAMSPKKTVQESLPVHKPRH